MFLIIDIGNTNIKIALFKGQKIFQKWRIDTDKKARPEQYRKLLKSLLSQRRVRKVIVKQIIICSVVPKLTTIFEKISFRLLKIKPLIVGKNILAPIRNLYHRPEQVGQDRLVNAAAAMNRYGSPVVVVDFGTAVTFDVVSAKGSYVGGIIVPGLQLAMQALISKATLLPKITLSKPKVFLGRHTGASMRSGIVYGYSFLVEGILQRLKKELKPCPLVVATGGEAAFMRQYCRSIDKIDENLTLKGLNMILQRRNKTKKLKKR